MALGARRHFGAPIFEFEVSIGSKYIVLKQVLVTLLGLFDASRSESAPPEWFCARGIVAPLLPPYAPDCPPTSCGSPLSDTPLIQNCSFLVPIEVETEVKIL